MRTEPTLNTTFIKRSGSRAYFWCMGTLAVFLTLLAVLGPPGAFAVRADANQDEVEAATKSGKIRPLSEILNVVQRNVPGKVLDIRVDNNGSPWLYRFKVRGQKGDVTSVIINAETGTIIEIRGQR
jgi:uncharacterized membrane protein YkoI